MQLAGQICPVCGKAIVGVRDGATCVDCGSPIHRECANVEPIGFTFGGCAACGTTDEDLKCWSQRERDFKNATNSELGTFQSQVSALILYFGFPLTFAITVSSWGFLPLHFVVVFILLVLAIRKFLRLNASL